MHSEPLLNLSVAEFLDRLAARAPTPGGGSVAALAGALAAALGRMVAAFTLGNPKFAAVEAATRAVAQRLERADALFRGLVDEDAVAYELLAAALRVEKSDPRRPAEVARAALLAGSVPLETAALAAGVAADLAVLQAGGNPHLRTDAEAAGHLARAAVLAGAANVRANLPLMAAEDARQIEAQLAPLLARVGVPAAEI